MVHDFAWAADPDFIHDMILGPNDVELHFFYLNNPEILENWNKLQGDTVKMLVLMKTSVSTPTNNTLLFKVEMEEWNILCARSSLGKGNIKVCLG